MTKIIDHLFLGNIDDARYGIKHNLYSCVINLSGVHLKQLGNRVCIHNIDAVDDEKYRLDHWFDYCCNIIDRCLKSNLDVLVNCYAGISRSSSIIIAYLIKKFGLSPSCALSFVKRKKNDIHPNNGFIMQLCNWAKK